VKVCSREISAEKLHSLVKNLKTVGGKKKQGHFRKTENIATVLKERSDLL
jgi:hypothetical protein